MVFYASIWCPCHHHWSFVSIRHTFWRRKGAFPFFILQHGLHKPVAFIILPIFALANTCITFNSDWFSGMTNLNSIGILVGLLMGKPFGIFIFSLIAVSMGLCVLPKELKWKHVLGVGLLGGIGFTMSIFITLLAYEQEVLVTQSKSQSY